MFASVGYADCSVPQVISAMRPGAEWTINNKDALTLVWFSAQPVPTRSEILQAVSDCVTAEAARKLQKQQARLDVKNGSLTQAQRLQALLILLDYDQ